MGIIRIGSRVDAEPLREGIQNDDRDDQDPDEQQATHVVTVLSLAQFGTVN